MLKGGKPRRKWKKSRVKTQKCFRGSYKIFPSSLSEANFSPPPHKLLAPPPVMVTETAPLPVTVMETELLVVTVTVTEPMPATVIRSVRYQKLLCQGERQKLCKEREWHRKKRKKRE
jgi:hypothetical protein